MYCVRYREKEITLFFNFPFLELNIQMLASVLIEARGKD